MSFWKRNWGDPAGRYLQVDGGESKESAKDGVGKEVQPDHLCKSTAVREVLDSQQEPDQLLQRFGKVRSALSEGTVVNGKLSFDATVRIDGRLKGEIFSSKTLIVGAGGEVDADITVASLIVFGAVKGMVKASDRVELLAGANLEGEVISPVLVVAEGANFNGNSRISCSSKVVNVVVESDRLDEENT